MSYAKVKTRDLKSLLEWRGFAVPSLKQDRWNLWEGTAKEIDESEYACKPWTREDEDQFVAFVERDITMADTILGRLQREKEQELLSSLNNPTIVEALARRGFHCNKNNNTHEPVSTDSSSDDDEHIICVVSEEDEAGDESDHSSTCSDLGFYVGSTPMEPIEEDSDAGESDN